MSSRRRAALVIGGAAVTLVGLITAGLIAAPALRSPQQVAADAAPPPATPITALVENRVVAEPVVFRGQVRPGPNVPVRAPSGVAGDRAVITAVAIQPGDVVGNGTRLFDIAGRPVFAVVSPFPFYRDLTPGADGPDVRVVQQALTAAGFRVGVDGVFGPATERAVTRWYAAHSSRPDPAGAEPTVEPGDTPAAGVVALPRSALVAIDRDGRVASAVPARVGGVVTDPDTVLIELDGGAAFVEGSAPAAAAAALTVGDEAELADEVTGAAAQLRIRAVGAPAPTDDGRTAVAVTLDFAGQPLPPAEHSVRITVGAVTAAPVLAVPITAVYSRPDGSEHVTVLIDGRPTEVRVTTGRPGGGFVELLDPAPQIQVGVEVVVGSDWTTGPR